jgi:hypothetical protein
MVQVLVDHVTRAVLAYGYFPMAQPVGDVVQVDDALLATLQQPGTKTLNADGTISVTAPGPIVPPPKTADQQTVATWANQAAPLSMTQAVAQAIARLLGAL